MGASGGLRKRRNQSHRKNQNSVFCDPSHFSDELIGQHIQRPALAEMLPCAVVGGEASTYDEWDDCSA